MVQWGASKPSIMKDIFFCLSTQSSTGILKNGKITAARSAATALALKAIWLDVDVGKDKGYATIEEALTAISNFYKDANLCHHQVRLSFRGRYPRLLDFRYTA